MKVSAVNCQLSFFWLAVSFPLVSSSQVFEQIETGDTCSYFGELVPDVVTTFTSDHEAERVIQNIVDASGLVQNFAVHAAGVPNAAAVIREDKRFILYNQYFMQNTRQATNSSWSPVSIMAHEVGHHLNGHTLDNKGSRPRLELEADYYSGFILQRLGANIDEARTAMDKLGSPSASSTHPAKHDRLAAITSGWTKACESDPRCGSGEESRTTKRDSSEGQGRSRPTDKDDTPSDPDSCEYAQDGECDEPDLCPTGTDISDCRPKGTRRSREEYPYPVPQQSLYCCDPWGRKWCQVTVNPGPPGTPCWCAGVPGSGVICP